MSKPHVRSRTPTPPHFFDVPVVQKDSSKIRIGRSDSVGPGLALVFFTCLSLTSPSTLAQGDSAQTATVAIHLREAEDAFLQNNLQLLAARCGVNASKASVVQARLWPNPTISVEQNIYNPQTQRYFDFTATGNTGIQLQQLFVLAGKRDKQVRLAEINARMAENNLSDVLRALKLELRTDFYDLFFLQQALKFYDESVPAVKRTVDATEKIYDNRYVLLSELLRLKALLYSLESERLEVLNRINDLQGDLRVLLHDTSSVRPYYVPAVTLEELDMLSAKHLDLLSLIRTALDNRPDHKNADETVRYDETNLALQHALQIPDVNVGGLWSRQGSFIPDYFALTVGVDLPLFNRNQGNIDAAEWNLRSDNAQRESVRRKVEREVTTAYQRAVQAEELYHRLDRRFADEYKTLVDGMTTNYQRRNISIIVFTDFYESYRTSMLQMNKLRNDRIDALEVLNFAVGTDVIAVQKKNQE